MYSLNIDWRNVAVSLAVATFIAGPALADDTEIFQGTAVNSGAPNILLILDTSGSMSSSVSQRASFDPTQTYDSTSTGDCDPANVYYVKTGTPTCSSASFATTNLKCSAASTALFSSGKQSGAYTGNGIRWVFQTTTQTASSYGTTKTTTQNVTVTYTDTQVAVTQTSVTTTLVQRVRISTGAATTLSTTAAPPVAVGSPSSNTTTGAESATNSGTPTTATTTAPTVTGTPTVTTSYSWLPALGIAATTNTVGPTAGSSTTTVSVAKGTPAAGTPTIKTTTSAGASVQDSQTTGATYTLSGRQYHDVTTVSHVITTTTTTTTTKYTRNDVQTSIKATPYTSTTTTTAPVSTDVECDGDKTTAGTNGYPNNVSPAAGSEWTSNQNNSYWNTGGALQKYTFYSGNYLNYLTHTPGTVIGTRLQVVQDAAATLLDQLTGVNVGLMRYSTNDGGNNDSSAAGGMVTYAMSSVDTDRAPIESVINGYTPDGYTPLSETLYEAYLYFTGGAVGYGSTSKIHSGSQYVDSLSVPASRDPLDSTRYKTPITAACQKNYIVYLTDGEPTKDNQADTAIAGLSQFASLGGGCDDTTKAPYGGTGGWGTAGKCLAGLAQYMNKADMSPLTSPQNVSTYFIGFGSDFTSGGTLNAAFNYLDAAATRGGGRAYQATDLTGLSNALADIVHDIASRNTSFISPTVAVNAFNKTQTLNDLYVSVFQPNTKTHWPGNVKKYHVKDGAIVDWDGRSAVDPVTGFFNHSARSVWSAAADGESVPLGGAANKLPVPTARNVYTYLGTNPTTPVDLTLGASGTAELVDKSNGLITGPMLGLSVASTVTRDNLLDWIRGMDVTNANGNGATAPRNVMGDPVHAKPAVVIYGGTEANPDAVIYAPTNDGYLHAIGSGDNDGVELWSFIPQDVLGTMANLYADPSVSSKQYTLDGDVRVLKFDQNGNDLIDAGDQVIIYFGQGRGGQNYYALDVTDKTKPKFMWTIGASQLPGIGQAWSTPVVARVNISGAAQNSQKLVLIFGGGYDSLEDTNVTGAGYNASDNVGNKIFMVDAITGALLWSAGSSGATLNLTKMDHAIPSDVSVLDTNGDGYADRIYAGDVAGQIWRFDITNGNTASSLVAGGVIASLGSHDEGSHTAANNRRFYYPPDVSLAQTAGGSSYYNIAIGSGYRGHPLNTSTHDRFYAIRDKQPLTALTQIQYNSLTVVLDSALDDVTTTINPTIATTSPGWKLLLDYPSGWVGEKVLAASTTINNQTVFTTYSPQSVAVDTCNQTSVGRNRAYTISTFDGSPIRPPTVTDPNNPTVPAPSPADRYVDLAQSGIAPEVVMLFPGGSSPLSCISGAEKLPDGSCPKTSGVQKTYWRQSGVE
jgi:type IV pilus assembly protein PilY1